jgi:hypothetical protein
VAPDPGRPTVDHRIGALSEGRRKEASRFRNVHQAFRPGLALAGEEDGIVEAEAGDLGLIFAGARRPWLPEETVRWAR